MWVLFDNIYKTEVLRDFSWSCLRIDWYKMQYEYYYAIFLKKKRFSTHPVFIIKGLSAYGEGS